MRIISGKYRGMKLTPFSGDDIRPTADRVKESLFNILASKISGASVLDMFCGSGNLGIECLSRGAAYVHFNDCSRDSIAVLKKNLARIDAANIRITASDFSCCINGDERFDLVFIDPPYRSEAGLAALNMLARGGNLNDGAIVVYERDLSFEGDLAGLEKYDERKYGKTYLTFFKKGENI